jgi:hypothetical protein
MAKPDKRYDLSRYISNALTKPINGSILSTDTDTDNDNYLFAQSVMDMDTPEATDNNQNLIKWISHAKSICNDVIKLTSSAEDDYLVPDSGETEQKDKISLAQTLYLLGLMYQLKPFEILDALHLAKISPALWAKNSSQIYRDNLDSIKTMNAEQLEAVVMDNALNNPNANIERMFALKAWIPKYKDNAPAAAAPSVVIRISLDGEQLDANTGRRTYDITDSIEDQVQDQ